MKVYQIGKPSFKFFYFFVSHSAAFFKLLAKLSLSKFSSISNLQHGDFLRYRKRLLLSSLYSMPYGELKHLEL